ncbi:zinc finger, RING/FYVE/PHD-type containing protein [Tanacetum coccineum]
MLDSIKNDTSSNYWIIASTYATSLFQELRSDVPKVYRHPRQGLGSVNHAVYALETLTFSNGDIPESCKDIATISVPVLKQYGGIVRSWDSRYTSYMLLIITGVPTLVFAIVLLCYIRGKVRNHDQGQHQSVNLSAMAITPQTRSTTGLDGITVESYPKTILGESFELPKDDSTCAICLSDYKPKEALRTIPECNHYFHVDCVDEWLKLNATCPVCRKSPEIASLVTPCSSLSVNSTNASHRTSQ